MYFRQWRILTCTRKEFEDVRSESERHGSVGIELARRVIHVEFEVGNVYQSGVLMNVHHVGIETGEVENVLGEAGQR